MFLTRIAGVTMLLVTVAVLPPAMPGNAAALGSCTTRGWFPTDFDLKDHTVFRYGGYTYIASIYSRPGQIEDRFAYARSTDLCVWEDIGPILATRTPGAWDEARIWAPFVIEEGGVYYMSYTGVTKDFTQSIMLATSTDPSNPNSWQPRGMVFQPAHANAVWPGPGKWSDARDPHILKYGNVYYLYYTGLDKVGESAAGIVGAARSSSLEGPWEDLGAVLTTPGEMPESASAFLRNGVFYLSYNSAYVKAFVRTSNSPLGSWSEPQPLAPGWAHEFWQDESNEWMASFLITRQITIHKVSFDSLTTPPTLRIMDRINYNFIPITHSP